MVIDFRQFAYLTGAPTLRECPPDTGAEVAFAGRSNAGKSSAINALTDNKKLARTSKTPGRTQLINFFSQPASDGSQRLVDLPGYGYAKVPLQTKLKWQKHLNHYLEQRQSLKGLILLVDIRQPFQAFDEMMIDWARASGLPLHILLTKSDKLKPNQARNMAFQVKKQMQGQEGMSVQLFSAPSKQGLDELKQVITGFLSIEAGES